MADAARRPRVKICGLTRREDAELAARLGADYLGVIFAAKSPRCVTPEQAREVLDFAPRPPVIGVFVNAPRAEIERAFEIAGLAGVQLHGEESPADCVGLPGYRIKAFRVKDASSFARVDDYDTDAVLCDTHVKGAHGGTGQTFDHGLVADLARRRPLFLAGGLGPDNVVGAIERVRPFAVDVSSGVEAAPGRKDPAKVENFFANLRAAGLA